MQNTKFIDYKSCINNYKLTKNQIDKIIIILEDFLNKLSELQTKQLTFSDKLAVLGFYCEIFILAKDKEKCITKIYELLNDLKGNIENQKYVDVSLFGGLTNIAVFIQPIVQMTGYFKKFQKNLNKLIIEETSKQSIIYKNNLEWNRSSYFDIISGLSGIATYLFALDDEEAKKSIKDVMEYFIVLSEYRSSDNVLLPGWYIKGKDLPTKEYRELFKSGCVNYSLSHGIAGPLYILSKGLCMEIEIEGQEEAIKRILGEYQKARTYVNEVCIWPGMMQLNDYLNKTNLDDNLRMSWCYGSLGILPSIITAGKAIQDSKLVEWGKNQLLKISEISIDNYYLDSPIICHGYAGASVIFRKSYDNYKNEKYLLRAKEIVNILLSLYNSEFPYGYKDFTRMYTDNGFTEKYEDKLTLLEGSTGICTELAAYLKEESWFDKMLFFS